MEYKIVCSARAAYEAHREFNAAHGLAGLPSWEKVTPARQLKIIDGVRVALMTDKPTAVFKTTCPGDPAFPCGADPMGSEKGMTKRELFAALLYSPGRSVTMERDSEVAVEDADRLIEALNES